MLLITQRRKLLWKENGWVGETQRLWFNLKRSRLYSPDESPASCRRNIWDLLALLVELMSDRWPWRKIRSASIRAIAGCLTVNDVLSTWGVYLIFVYSCDCNKLNKANMLSVKISREFKNSGIFTPSIDTSRPPRDPYRPFKYQHRCQNPHSGSLCCHH